MGKSWRAQRAVDGNKGEDCKGEENNERFMCPVKEFGILRRRNGVIKKAGKGIITFVCYRDYSRCDAEKQIDWIEKRNWLLGYCRI